MKLIFEANVLKPAIARLKSVAGSASTQPILSHITIEALGHNKVQMVATDLEVELSAVIEAQVEDHGHWAIEGEQLAKIVANAPDGGQIKMELIESNQRMAIRYGHSRFKVNCLRGDDMPHLKPDGVRWSVELAGAELEDMLSIARFAGDGKDGRLYYKGVTFREMDGKVTTWAANGHHMMRVMTDLDTPQGFEPIILPDSSAHRALALFKHSAKITILATDRLLLIEGGAYTFLSKLIDAQSLDYERLAPKPSNAPTVTINREDLIGMVDALNGLVEKKGRALRFLPLDGAFYLCLGEKAEAEGECQLAAKCKATGVTTGMQGPYVRNVLAEFDQSEIAIDLSDDRKPIIFYSNNSNRTGYVAPMTTQPIDTATIGAGGE